MIHEAWTNFTGILFSGTIVAGGRTAASCEISVLSSKQIFFWMNEEFITRKNKRNREIYFMNTNIRENDDPRYRITINYD